MKKGQFYEAQSSNLVTKDAELAKIVLNVCICRYIIMYRSVQGFSLHLQMPIAVEDTTRVFHIDNHLFIPSSLHNICVNAEYSVVYTR